MLAKAESDAAQAAVAADTAGTNAWADSVYSRVSSELSQQEGVEVVKRGDNGINVRIGDVGMFRAGSTILSESGQRALSIVGDSLLRAKGSRIIVEGHTDNVPVGSASTFSSNQDLSFKRAAAAMNYLNFNAGIPLESMAVAGLGDRFPIADNNTAEGRQRNRRVEIVLTEGAN